MKNHLEDQDMDHNGSMTIGKQKTQQEESEDDTPLLCTDGLQPNDTKNLKGIMDGQRDVVDTWTILQLLQNHTLQPCQDDEGVTTRSFFEAPRREESKKDVASGRF